MKECIGHFDFSERRKLWLSMFECANLAEFAPLFPYLPCECSITHPSSVPPATDGPLLRIKLFRFEIHICNEQT